MDEEQLEKRMQTLRAQKADIAFAPDVYAQLRRLLAAVHKHFEQIDPYVLDLEPERLDALVKALSPLDRPTDVAMRRLSHLDMFDLERLALTSEGYFAELGGAEALGMSPPELTALTETLGHLRKSCFATAERSAG
ncbi:MAG: hypothetical protein GC185_13585 [Alphaproteobacteria bacterium]|nr:hypothetical protein [Alphaproteobacteria bacterium]